MPRVFCVPWMIVAEPMEILVSFRRQKILQGGILRGGCRESLSYFALLSRHKEPVYRRTADDEGRIWEEAIHGTWHTAFC